MGVTEVRAVRASRLATWSAARRLSLALPLVVDFALHNGTDGFSIGVTLVSDTDFGGNKPVPSWGFLLVMGAIGGGPTVVGTPVGYHFISEAVSVVFLT
jgi:ZIP family zinc transporter